MASQNDNSRITENHPWVRNFGPTSKRPTTDLIAGQLYNNTTTGNLETYNGASWVSLTSGAGTSFPGTPATGQTYFRTDRLLEYAYDGTRWLTTQLFYLNIPFAASLALPIAANTSTHRGDNPEQTQDIYIISLDVSTLVDPGTYDASNYWTFQLVRVINGGGTSNIGSAQTTWATGRVTNQRYPNIFAINTQFTAINVFAFRIDFAKVGSPSTMNPNPAILAVRYVG